MRGEAIFAVGLLKEEPGIKGFDLPLPEVGRKQALVRVIEAGIDDCDHAFVCGHDSVARTEDGSLALGHEAVGIVEAFGFEVSDLKVGDVVVPVSRKGCNFCDDCLEGRSDHCHTGLYTERGIQGEHGFFTEYFAEDERYLLKVPVGLEWIAVLTHQLSLVERVIEEIKAFQRSSKMIGKNFVPGKPGLGVIVGAGPLGILMALRFMDNGISACVVDNLPKETARARLVVESGAGYLRLEKGDSAFNLLKQFGSPQLLIETRGDLDSVFGLIPGLARNGICVLAGNLPCSSRVNVNGCSLFRSLAVKNQVMLGASSSGFRHYRLALEELSGMAVKYESVLRKVITHYYSLQEYERAFRIPPDDEVKSVFKVSNLSDELKWSKWAVYSTPAGPMEWNRPE